MKKICFLTEIFCLTMAATSLAALPPTGPIPDDEKADIIATLRVVRLAADQETRDCVGAGRTAIAQQLTRLSSEIIATNLVMRTAGYTYEDLSDRLANKVRPVQSDLLLQGNAGACEPSKVIDEIEKVIATGGVFLILHP